MNLIRSLGVTLTLCILVLPPALAEIPSASGACVEGTMETTSSSDFTLLESGAVVRHIPTGLEWRRCAEGMDWTGNGCMGTASTMSWRAALQHAHSQSGWRLPNLNELNSIVERCRVNPAINQQVFPNTPASLFWSASPYAGYSDYAWTVVFYYGYDYSWYKINDYRVRLVRGGQ